MKIEEAYSVISSVFDGWVRVMEYQTRVMEVQDLELNELRILIISPPTDRGLEILTRANPRGESYLLCFSTALQGFAKQYSTRRGIVGLRMRVEPFFGIPFLNDYFDAIYANCFFDFCLGRDLADIVSEISRVLKPNGHLFSVYMDLPTGFFGQTWVTLLSNFPWLGHICHPVDMRSYLSKRGYRVRKDLSTRRLGFPVEYLLAEKCQFDVPV
jgi:SAM-dependent methyltransferase